MTPRTTDTLQELDRESRVEDMGRARAVALIDLPDFDLRRAEIADQLWDAATGLGLFQPTGHGLPIDQIEDAFALSEAFFALPDADKARMPLKPGTNAGWESKSQVRPSTGTPGQKESHQIIRPRMSGL